MEPKRLYRSRSDKMLCGVCGGLAKYLNIDANLLRILFVLFCFTGMTVIAYIAAALILPEEP